MKRVAGLILALAASTIAALGLVMLAPERASTPVVGQDELAAPRSGEMSRQSERIDARRELVLDRLRAKDRIADALVRGELTLDQAVERFRHLTENDPAAVAAMRARYGVTGDELYYRNVLGFARAAARHHPDLAKAVLPKLEAEALRRFPPAFAAELSIR